MISLLFGKICVGITTSFGEVPSLFQTLIVTYKKEMHTI
jgi:hypothetical protein